MSVNIVEAVWLLICLTGVVATTILLLDSLDERELVHTLLNGRRKVREVIVRGNIRREAMRLLKQVLLTAAVVPSLFRSGETSLVFDLSTAESSLATAITITILCLMSIPILLLATSIADKRDRTVLRKLAIEIIREDESAHEDAVVAMIETEGAKAEDRSERMDASIERSDAAIDRGDAAIERADDAIERANKTLGKRSGAD